MFKTLAFFRNVCRNYRLIVFQEYAVMTPDSSKYFLKTSAESEKNCDLEWIIQTHTSAYTQTHYCTFLNTKILAEEPLVVWNQITYKIFDSLKIKIHHFYSIAITTRQIIYFIY